MSDQSNHGDQNDRGRPRRERKPVEPKTITPYQVMGLAQLSEATLYRLLAKKGMPSGFKIGRKRLFHRDQIEAWLAMGCPSEAEFLARWNGGRPRSG